MQPHEEIELPPPGVGRYAALHKYTPEGGNLWNIDKDRIGIFNADHQMVGIIE